MIKVTSEVVRSLTTSIVGWFSSAMAILGIILAVIAVFQSLSLRTQNVMSDISVALSDFDSEIDSIHSELSRLRNARPIDRESPETTTGVSDSIAELNSRVGALQDEVQIFRDMLLDEPARLVTLPLLKRDIEVLQEVDVQMQMNVNRLVESVNDSNDLMRWVIGALITLVIGVFGIIVTVVANLR